MARGKRNLTLDEQYNQILVDIENYKLLLDKANTTKKELESQMRMKRLEELDELISKSGKSFEEAKALLA